MNEPNWNLGACRIACNAGEAHTDWWFPERGQDNSKAIAICKGCEIREACLEWANATKEKYGIWGGLSDRQRRRRYEPRSKERVCKFCELDFTAKGREECCSEACAKQWRKKYQRLVKRPKSSGVTLANGHGTHSSYSHGCRCIACRAAEAEYQALRRRVRARAS